MAMTLTYAFIGVVMIALMLVALYPKARNLLDTYRHWLDDKDDYPNPKKRRPAPRKT